MSDITQARPYAKAIFQMAKSDGSFDTWEEQLGLLEAFLGHEDIEPFLTSPKFSKEQKAEKILAICSGKISKESENLIRTLSHNDRLTLLPVISKMFKSLSDEEQNTIEVKITSAYAIDDGQKQDLEKALKSKLRKDVVVSYGLDESLIGGVVIHAGDQVIDGSVRNRLSQLSTGLMTA